MNKIKSIVAGFLIAIFAFSYAGIASAVEVTNEEIAAVNENAGVNVYNGELTNVAKYANEKTVKLENLPKVKNVSSNIVKIYDKRIVIPAGNVFKVAFAQDFTTKNLKEGQEILFNLPNGLYTQEGTLLLPCGTQIVATVKSYVPPKVFNRNAKVMMDFSQIIVPNSPSCQMGACVYGKYNTLQRSGWATFAKPAIWTVGLFGVGAGLGAAFGACAGAAGLGCLAFGMPIGGGVGLIVGLVTPGLHYKAKAGKEIPVMLTQDMVLANK